MGGNTIDGACALMARAERGVRGRDEWVKVIFGVQSVSS